ncbi:MAG: ELWxxDGT repeat protein, partial [Verrucomicrobiaceae bacterium]
ADDVVVAGGSTLYFVLGNGGMNQLWKSDGTAGGTVLVKDLSTVGSAGARVKNLAAVPTAGSTRLYFNFTDDAHGEEIWTSNGTGASTGMIIDLSTGTAGTQIDHDGDGSSSFAIVGSNLLFVTGDSGPDGAELWKTDGTEAGTLEVKDINTNPGEGSYPRHMTAWNGLVYFAANLDGGPEHNGSSNADIWKTDGTEAGTTIFFGADDVDAGSLTSMCPVGNALYVIASRPSGNTLWALDAAGTETMVKVLPANDISGGSRMWSAGSRLFFTYAYNLNNGVDYYFDELWTSTGTAASTVMVKQLHPGESGTEYFRNAHAAIGNTSYFLARGYDTEIFSIFKSDGTAAGTAAVYNDPDRGELDEQIYDEQGTGPGILASNGSSVFFVGADSAGAPGGEPWRTDGTTTENIVELNPTQGPNEGNPYNLIPFGSGIFLNLAATGNGGEPAVSDGTSAGTVQMKDARSGVRGSKLESPIVLGSNVIFSANDGTHGREPWVSDGTIAGTALLKDITVGLRSGGFYDPVVMGGKVWFSAGDSNGLWSTDGTAAGTTGLTYPGNVSSLNNGKAVVGSVIYLPGYVTNGTDPAFGEELVKTDGTTGGTVMVKDINPGDYSGSNPNHLTPIGSTLYFAADDGTTGNELWKSDGTELGTVRIKDINDSGDGIYSWFGNDRDDPSFFNFNGTLIFVADDGTHGAELWKSNGTTGGTVMVSDINPYGGSDPHGFAVVGTTLYFFASDGTHGEELWKTDGTSAGTVLVKDIHAGPDGGRGGDHGSLIVAFNGLVYFAGDDGYDGTELWSSDGTADGTTKVVDVGPVGIGSGVDYLTVSGTKLFFAAGTDSTGGQELYMVQNRPPVAAADLFGAVVPGTPTTLDVLANDRDPDGNHLSITGLSGLPADATVTHNGSTVTFTGGATFANTGVNTFTYTISADQGGTSTATVTIRTASQPIVGSWVFGDPTLPNNSGVITFLNDGTYFMADDSDEDIDKSAGATGTKGMEHGTYAWNESTGAFSATTLTDTTGENGLSHPSGAVTVAVTGNTLAFTDSVEGTFTFARVANTTNPIVGSWLIRHAGQAESDAVITFLANGSYFMAEDGNSILDPTGQDGMERGTYTWNQATGAFSSTTAVDTSGEWGL